MAPRIHHAPVRFNLFAAVLVGLVAIGSAQAGRPLQTEDAGVLAASDCEVEGAMLRETAAGDSRTERGLALGCGVGLRSQLGLAVTRTREGGPAVRTAELGGKTSLWRGAGHDAGHDAGTGAGTGAGASSGNGVTVTLAWAVDMASQGDSGWRHGASRVELVASVPAGTATTLHLNLGHARDRPSRLITTTWGVAAEHAGFDLGGLTWAPMAEVFGADKGSPWWNLALRATLVAERVFVDLSCGRQIRDGRPRLVTVGFKLAF